jgi:hypothetical protein
MQAERYLRGSTEQCPKCGNRKVAFDPALRHEGYGPGIAFCSNCKTLWEPFRPDEIWDKDDAYCSLKEPCNNCAFRPGSSEQADREKWINMLQSLRLGGAFYCHKGVPITSDAEHGFAYPKRIVTLDVAGETITKEIENTSKMRLCRGFLNAAPRLQKWAREEKIDFAGIEHSG